LESIEQVAPDILELTGEISEIKGVSAIILFGSHSRGDFDEGSDIDLLIVFNDNS